MRHLRLMRYDMDSPLGRQGGLSIGLKSFNQLPYLLSLLAIELLNGVPKRFLVYVCRLSDFV
jgi:hypothetical protein